MSVAIVTCLELPEPDVDEDILMTALAARGVQAKLVAWDDPAAKWADFDLCVLRSTWNYYHHHDAFLAWIERTANATSLVNPPSIVRWNAHKSYLKDLEKRGVAVVPTAWVNRGERTSLASIMDARKWDRVVVKPAVSAGSFATERIDRASLDRGEAHLAKLVRDRDMMVQPYVRSVEDYGERSLVCIDGALSHAIRKTPRFGSDRENVSAAVPIADDERAFARKVLDGIDEKLLYARVDVARSESGAPMVMELELIEPSLFLKQFPSAADTLAAAVRDWRESRRARRG